MTQAINLANFANNLNSAGQLDPNALGSAVSITKGGTGAVTVEAARLALTAAKGSMSLFDFNEVGGNLYIRYNGNNILRITQTGALISVDDVTAYGTL